jgi:exodeoxyribonuclease VII small subunit
METTSPTYEQALDQLRKIVGQLENGQQGLEQSLELFEKGIELTRMCDEKLKAVEDRVKILLNREQAGAEAR